MAVGCAALQGCVLAAAGAAGAAGGYEAKRHGYEVQSPVREDSAGGYKGQAPVVRDPTKDRTAPKQNTQPATTSGTTTGNPYDNRYQTPERTTTTQSTGYGQ